MIRRLRALGPVVVLVLACTSVVPATWRQVDADADAARDAARQLLQEDGWALSPDPNERYDLTTEFQLVRVGEEDHRERYRVRVEEAREDRPLTVFVRHDIQARSMDTGRPTWGPTQHDPGKQVALMDRILRALQAKAPTDGDPAESE